MLSNGLCGLRFVVSPSRLTTPQSNGQQVVAVSDNIAMMTRLTSLSVRAKLVVFIMSLDTLLFFVSCSETRSLRSLRACWR